jgi:hypothetical protein
MYEPFEWMGHRYSRAASGSLLPESLRRDVADLNRQFLHLAQMSTGPLWQPWLTRSPFVAGGLESASVEAIAACPFTLFELKLADVARAAPEGAEVRDEQHPRAGEFDLQVQGLAHGALTLAWRLADESPLSLRLTLGLSTAAELLMNETRVSGLLHWARAANLLGARWPEHVIFWPSLLRAGYLRDRAALTRVHCLGLTLLVSDLGIFEPDGAVRRRGAMRERR